MRSYAPSRRHSSNAFWLLASVFAFALAPMPAHADTLIDRVLGSNGGKTKPFACFTRVYDAPHMAAHPQQAVTSMAVLASPNSDEATVLRLRLRATFRTRKGVLASEGDCTVSDDGQSLHCGVACDGGEMDVSIKDATAVLLAVPVGARLWKPGSGRQRRRARRFRPRRQAVSPRSRRRRTMLAARGRRRRTRAR